MYTKGQQNWNKQWIFILSDAICFLVAYITAFVVRFKGLADFSIEYLKLMIAMGIIEPVVSLILNNLHNVFERNFLVEAASVLELSIGVLATTVLYIYTFHMADFYSRILVYLSVGLFFVICLFERLCLKHQNSNYLLTPRSIVIVGDVDGIYELIELIEKEKLAGYSIKCVAVLDENDQKIINNLQQKLPESSVFVSFEEISDYICRNWIDEIFIAGQAPSQLTENCATMGVTVHSVLNIKSAEKNKQFLEEIGGQPVLTTAYNYIMPYQAIIKRIFDIVGGIIGCCITVILFVFVAPLIEIKSPGPVFFKQERIGRNGKKFQIYKFRSMYLDAEERKKELIMQNKINDGMMFKIENDPRIIPGIGNFIRKTSIDEFPQFWNVLKGDMSLVGTRPPTVDEWEKYEFHHRARLAIKPGITGLWQVSGRSTITNFEDVVKLDTEYICHFRLSLDFVILCKTILALFKREGAM